MNAVMRAEETAASHPGTRGGSFPTGIYGAPSEELASRWTWGDQLELCQATKSWAAESCVHLPGTGTGYLFPWGQEAPH